jgi:hypothetical protein
LLVIPRLLIGSDQGVDGKTGKEEQMSVVDYASTSDVRSRLSPERIQRISPSSPEVRSLAASDPQEFAEQLEMMKSVLEGAHMIPPDLSDNPAYKDFAQVKVDGKVIATVDNNGCVTTSNAVGARIAKALPGDVCGKSGPVLAAARAKTIAEIFGGDIIASPTALKQTEWEKIPIPRSNLDYQGLAQDTAYQNILKLQQSHAAFLAQQLTQQGTS